MKSQLILSLICSTAIGLTLNTLAQAKQGNHGHGGNRGHGHDRAQQARDNHRPNHPGGPEKAKTRDPGVNHRQENQHDRIAQGVRSGQLTKDEAKQLAAEQKNIRQEEKAYKADSVLTQDERKDLQQDLNAANKDIYQEKHDADTRSGTTPTTSGTKDPVVNTRQENQQDRIAQGIHSGELTKKEALLIENKEARLAKLEKRMKEDGTLTPEERARLQHELNKLNTDIYKQKHDAQDRH